MFFRATSSLLVAAVVLVGLDSDKNHATPTIVQQFGAQQHVIDPDTVILPAPVPQSVYRSQQPNITMENCESCPTVVVSNNTQGTVVCIGNNFHEMKASKHLSTTLSSALPVTSKKCESICSCQLCATCGVQSRFMPNVVKTENGHMMRITGYSRHMLLLFNDTGGREFLAKLGSREVDTASKVLTLRTIRDECGFEDIVPEERCGPLKTRVLNGGRDAQYVSGENVVFSEFFDGAQQAAIPGLPRSINGSQVILAALHDFLVGIGARTGSNLLVQHNGNIKLIDNHDRSLENTINGVFLPGTDKWYSKRSSYSRVFDYRCHIGAPMLHRDYPPRVRHCLEDIANLSLEQVIRKFKISSHINGAYFQERAQWMLDGFENAIVRHLNTYPKNTSYFFFPAGHHELPHIECKESQRGKNDR